jgi:protein disulfide-isomerase
MKKLMMLAILCLGISVFASGKEWTTDMDAALKQSEKTGKPILVDFSGSDWCGWCIKLDDEVFSKKAFIDFAKENLILVLLDFPRSKAMSAEQKKKNNALAKKYGVSGFPTVLILDSKGKVLLKTGYRRGGPAKYIEYLKAKVPALKNAKVTPPKKKKWML